MGTMAVNTYQTVGFDSNATFTAPKLEAVNVYQIVGFDSASKTTRRNKTAVNT